jgi:cytochrome P450
VSEAPLIEIDPSSSSFKRKPYSAYARLRDESPVARVRMRLPGMPSREAFLIARYQDVSALLRDPRFAKDPDNAAAKVRGVPALFKPLTRNMLGVDDPDHARLKRLVQGAFTPRQIARLGGRTEAISSGLLDQLAKQESFDLIRDYALPLPVSVISELLGVPEGDRRRFARWSGAFIRGAASRVALMLSLPEMIAFLRYLKRLIAMKRAEPADDVITALISAEADGNMLDAEELMAMIAILLSAGHETTLNLIGNGMLALLDHPDAAEMLCREPALLESAIEELLRFASPVATSTHRYARENLAISGIEIPTGSLVFGLIAAANRDERQFGAADQLDIKRSPNRHLTFGEGGHYCIGAALARMEGKVAIRDILTRFKDLRLAVPRESLSWTPGLVLSGLKRLPVTTR